MLIGVTKTIIDDNQQLNFFLLSIIIKKEAKTFLLGFDMYASHCFSKFISLVFMFYFVLSSLVSLPTDKSLLAAVYFGSIYLCICL